MKKIISMIIVAAFCSLQFVQGVYAANASSNNYGIQVTPLPSNYNASSFNNNQSQNLPVTTLSVNSPQVGKGKVLKAFLQNDVSTSDAVKGDSIVVVLSENWYENGQLIAEAGSVINGIITSANAAGAWSKDGALQINFTSMETPAGEVYGLNAEKIDIQVEKEKNAKWKTAAKVGGTILAAAAIGAVFGLLGDGDGTKYTSTTTHTGNSTTTTTKTSRNKEYGKDVTKGVAVGAGVGLAVGIATIGLKSGNNITIPANTNFEIVLLDNIVKQSY